MIVFRIPSFSSFAIKWSPPQVLTRRASESPSCYFPNGVIAPTDYACNPSANVSPCCGFDMICLDNKICQSISGDNFRGTCTDQTWKSPGCPQFCTDGSYSAKLISCQNVTNSDLDFCCDHTVDCCDTGLGRFRFPSAGKPVTTYKSSANTPTLHFSRSTTSIGNSILESLSSPLVSSSSSYSETPISSKIQLNTGTARPTEPAATSLPSQTSIPASTSPLSTGAKAGIGTGASIGAIIIVVLSVLLWQSKRKNGNADETANKQNPFLKGELDSNEPQRPDHRVWELPGDMAHELGANRDGYWIWELPSR